ncbi:MAG: patatin-like phospholipase family protein [Deltaproteobacteria bacterium]
MDVGLVLTGGGARAAYQAGALLALSEILPAGAVPFRILSGVSAGGLNVGLLGTWQGDFEDASHRLRELWLELTPERVFRTDGKRMVGIGTQWMRNLSGGGFFQDSRINFLLDATPLRDFLHERVAFADLKRNIASGALRGFAITATSYATNTAVTWFDGDPDIENWVRATRIGIRTNLRLDHVMASASIPIFFPPVRIQGAWYGDGSVRMTAPLSPAIHMGADRLVVIGVRRWRAPSELQQVRPAAKREALPPSQIAGTLLNAVFLETIEADVERLEMVNKLVEKIPPAERGELRPIPTLMLRPSRDLGHLAADQYQRFPRFLRYLLSGLGAKSDTGSDLLSYLAFEPIYVGRLIELGYEDTLARRAEVEDFFAVGRRDERVPLRA